MQGQAIHNHPAPERPTQKARGSIEGGIISIAPISIIIAWAAFRQSLIDWLTLRVWFALWEVKRWHEARVRAGEPYRYDVSEVLAALKTKRIAKKQVEAALRLLQTLGIIHFSETTIWFASQLDDLNDSSLRLRAQEMLGHLDENNYQKGINFPRRILKFIITSQRRKPVLIGTALGLIIRCMLVKRYGQYKGCCRADWIAAVFGGDVTSISSARSKLIAFGWFVRLDTPQRVRNTFGDWFALALEVVMVVEDQAEEGQGTLFPVDNSEPIATQIEGPESPKSTKPEDPYKPVSSLLENFNNQITGVSRQITPPQNQPISWTNIQLKDISTPERREILFTDAVSRGILGDNQADKLTFFAAASRAIRKATQNAGGFLRSLIENPDYRGFIAQEDEDQALGWLKDLEQRDIEKMIVSRVLKRKPEIPTLSLDALTVQQLNANLKKAGYSGDLFKVVMRTPDGRNSLGDWTPERWQAAEKELLNYPLKVARAQLDNGEMDTAGEVMDDWFSGGLLDGEDAH